MKELKAEAAKLSQDDLLKFQHWCVSLYERRQAEEKSRSDNGISAKNLLKAFRESRGELTGSDERLCATGPRRTAILLSSFYESVRVKGTALDQDEDMLFFELAPTDQHFRLCCGRQITVPGDEIWQLKVTFLYSPPPALKTAKPTCRWFKTLDELEKFDAFSAGSSVIDKLEKLSPSSVSTTYERID